MSSLIRASQLWRVAAPLAWTLAGCARGGGPHGSASPAPIGRELSRDEAVAHVLSRLTFGARPGDAQRVAAMGIDRWVDEQLHPERISDSVAVAALRPIPSWSQPTTDVAALTVLRPLLVQPAVRKPPSGNATPDSLVAQLKVRVAALQFALNPDAFFAGKVVRAQVSDQQLAEVITDFWENHFSVFTGKMPSREAIVLWDRDVLRPHALGKFRDLLGAVAHSPAMLFYLDNHLSGKARLNENYGRELLELHTLGVDGGYTQHDVVEVARALTGWTIGPSRNPSVFLFRPEMHDTGPKTVLGHTLAAGRGIEDGEEVLDIVARHPSTARFIARKLVRRLVSDDPPASLVDRAAATFTRTDGDIREVVRTIVTSPEFFSRAAFRAKVKTPFELVVSMRRALDVPADSTVATVRRIAQLGQPIFGRQTPEGWPDNGGAWMNSGTILLRMMLGSDAANGTAPFKPIGRSPSWSALSSLPFEGQMDGVTRIVFGGVVDSATRRVMLDSRVSAPDGSDVGSGSRRLQALLTIALGSPEFQKR